MNKSLAEVWQGVLSQMQWRHGGLIRSWFDSMTPVDLDRCELTVAAVETGQLRYLKDHCTRAFVEAAQAATGRLVSVRFVGQAGGEEPAPTNEEEADADAPPLKLSPEYTLEGFVAGPGNRMAHAAAIATSDAPGRAYNPWFVHGPAGVGKTHLLHGVCHRILDRDPGLRVAFLTCEMFTSHFVQALEQGKLHSFRFRYRHMDVLMIDDIQFLAIGERSQEEFFHTFNTLYQDHRQIVLSADCLPKEIPNLEERLTSRFGWGLVTRIDPPCLETRIAIVRKKAKLRSLEIPDEAARMIATEITTNTRELEGALAKMKGYADLHGGPITVETARQVLDEVGPRTEPIVRVDQIIIAVTQRFGVRTSDLQSRKRSKSIALPRQVCMYLARRLTSHSLAEIGGYFGGRDHTTVLHADRLISSRRDHDEQLRALLGEIESQLRRA